MSFSGTENPQLNVYGVGDDGPLRIAGGITTVLTGDMYFTTLIVNGSLLTAGFAIHCLDLSGSGVIDCSGSDAIGITGGLGTSGGVWTGGLAGGNGSVGLA